MDLSTQHPLAPFVAPYYLASTPAQLTAAILAVDSAGGGIIALTRGIFTAIPVSGIGWDADACTNPITIKGQGRGVTTLKWPDHTGSIKSDYWGANCIIRGGSNFTLENLTLDGNKANQSPEISPHYEGCNGLVVYSASGHSNVTLIGVECKNTVHIGIAIKNVTTVTLVDVSANDTYNNHATYATVFPDYSWSPAVGIFVNQCTGVTYEMVSCNNNGLDGTQIHTCTDVVVTGGVYNNNGWGVKVPAGRGVGACGLYSNRCSNIIIKGARAASNSEAGIAVLDDSGSSPSLAYNVTFTNNRAVSNSDSGFQLYSINNLILSNNFAQDNGGDYIATYRAAGFFLWSISYVTVSGNQSYDSRAGASRTQLYGFNAYASVTNIVPTSTATSNIAVNNVTSNFNGM